jgi:hypothetical protein
MGTSHIGPLLAWLLAIWLAGLALVLIVKGMGFLRGLRELISSDLGAVAAGRIDPARVQLAMVTIFAAVVFVANAWRAIFGPVHVMPDIPDGLLTLVAGSHAIYLSGRVGRSLNNPKEGE